MDMAIYHTILGIVMVLWSAGIMLRILNTCREAMNSSDRATEYFKIVSERQDYLNVWHLPTLIKYFEDLEKYEEAAKCKKMLDESKQRLKI